MRRFCFLLFIIAFSLLLGIRAGAEVLDSSADTSSEAVYAWDAASLDSAVNAVADGGTITITGSILDYGSSINVSDKSFFIDLNGFTINLTSPDDGVSVSGGKTLTVTGTGTFNVTGSQSGISVQGRSSVFNTSGRAAVNAAATEGPGIYAFSGGTASISGNALGSRGGISADYNSAVNVGGNAMSAEDTAGFGAYAAYGSKVTVAGSVSGWIGACAETGGSVSVEGDAAGTFCAVQVIDNNSVVSIRGSAESGNIGADAWFGGAVYIYGAVSGGNAAIRADNVNFRIDAPVRSDVSLPPPHDGLSWDEYRAGISVVYKCRSDADRDFVADFITRLYNNILNRKPDKAGLERWCDMLNSGQINGGQAAYGFFFSDEMISRKLSDSDYLDILYTTLLNRKPDEAGRNGWLAVFGEGWPRENIFAGFVNSDEFGGLCSAAGISRGTYVPEKPGEVYVFVTRMYKICLDRVPDKNGLDGWVDLLISGSTTGTQVGYGFVFSDEMNEKNLSNNAFVDVLYRAFLGREPDAAGRIDWTSRLNNGTMTRESVFYGFAGSAEFSGICERFGIEP